MNFSDDCKETLCNVAIAGGALAMSVAGVNIVTGLVEFLTQGGNLAMKLQGGDAAKVQKLIQTVRKDVEKDAKKWVEAEFGKNSDAKQSIDAAIVEFDVQLPLLKPDLTDLVSEQLNIDAMVEAYHKKLPEHSILKNDPVGQRIFKSIFAGAFGLVRGSDSHMALLTSLSFEKVFTKLDEAQIDRDKKHNKLMDAVINNTGLPKTTLEPIFHAVEMEFPDSDIEAKVEEAVARIKALAKGSVDVGNLGEDIKALLEQAREILETTADVDKAVKSFQGKYDAAEGMMLQAALLAKEEARMMAASFRFDEAIAAYEKAARFNPDDPWHWYNIGDIRLTRGNLALALDEYLKGEAVAARTGDQRDLSVSYNKIGDVKVAQGDGAGGLKAYEDSLEIRKTLAKAEPSDSGWQRDISVSYNKIGDVKLAQGDSKGALNAFEDSLAIRETLAKTDPSNSGWQRDLSVSYDRIGDVKLAQGDGAGALKAYEDGLAIRERLAKTDPSNSGWQRDLSVSYNKIGDVKRAQGDGAGALKAYEADLAIAETLAKVDPSNSELQRDLSVSYEKIGDVKRVQGDGAGALKAYQDGLAIRETLAKKDPSNSGWQRDLSVSYLKIGDVMVSQGDGAGALKAYEDNLAIAETLAKADPSNSGWQRDLSVSYNKIGDVKLAQGDGSGALKAYEDGLVIAETLARTDPSNSEWQRDLIVSYVKLAEAGSDKKGSYERALAVAKELMENGRLAPVDHWMVAELEKRLKAAKGEQ